MLMNSTHELVKNRSVNSRNAHISNVRYVTEGNYIKEKSHLAANGSASANCNPIKKISSLI